jgi:hypothetical protein
MVVCVSRVLIAVIVVKVAYGFRDMMIIITDGQLGQVPPLTSCEARACVSMSGRSLQERYMSVKTHITGTSNDRERG